MSDSVENQVAHILYISITYNVHSAWLAVSEILNISTFIQEPFHVNAIFLLLHTYKIL